MVDIQQDMQRLRDRAEAALEQRLPAAPIHPARLHEAMRYAVLGGGKRFRPILVYAAGQAVGVVEAQLDGPAAAVEMIHAYSLVHDDLPSMDDDDLRRGQPTCHRAFDEATALLVGDALQSLAFHILAHDSSMVAAADLRLRMVEQLAAAAGSRGMAGGQAIDLAAVGRGLNIAELEDMHVHKTGALIRASVLLGAGSTRELSETARAGLDHYAKCLGLAFQIQDDILDVEGDTATLGKTQGADQARGKPTYPAIIGLTAAKDAAKQFHQEALDALTELPGDLTLLRGLADFVVNRLQ